MNHCVQANMRAPNMHANSMATKATPIIPSEKP